MKLIKKKTPLTLEFLLTKITEYDIFKYELGNFKIDKAFCSQLRTDNSPSVIVYVGKDNCLHYKDFGDSSVGGRAVDYIMTKHGLNYDQALSKIAANFGITDSDNNNYKKITSKYCKPILEHKYHSLIQVEVRGFTDEDLKYWLQYGISYDDLKKEKIYSVKNWYLNRKKQFIGIGELCFAYVYSEGYQIYYPNRKKNEGKWFCNISLKFIEGYEVIDKHDKILITKAKKDLVLFKKWLPDFLVLRLMNESISAFTPEVVEKLKSKQLWINTDNDKPGKSASWKITALLEKPHLNVPDIYLDFGVTDFSDWRKFDGHDLAIKEFLKIKKLIT